MSAIHQLTLKGAHDTLSNIERKGPEVGAVQNTSIQLIRRNTDILIRLQSRFENDTNISSVVVLLMRIKRIKRLTGMPITFYSC